MTKASPWQFIRGMAARALPAKRSTPTPTPPHRRLQDMSDLHLEIGQQYASFDFPVTAPHLILAGDIGCLIDYDNSLAFLQRQAARYDRVFLVLGNREFYGGISYPEGVQKARELVAEPSLEGKVTLLHQTRYDLKFGSPESPEPDIVVLGCVLWSQIAPERADRIGMAVSDFKQIHDWSVAAHDAAHAADLAWLRAELARVREEDQVVIVTHHAPLVAGTSRPDHKGSQYNSAFATDVCTGPEWSGVGAWVYGHTHWTADLKVGNGVRVVSNQHGYVFLGNTRPLDQGSKELPEEHIFNAGRFL